MPGQVLVVVFIGMAQSVRVVLYRVDRRRHGLSIVDLTI